MKQMYVIDKILLMLMLAAFACYGALLGVISGSSTSVWNRPYDPERFGEKIVTFMPQADVSENGAPVELENNILNSKNDESEECPYVICYRHNKKFAAMNGDEKMEQLEEEQNDRP